MTPPLVDYLQSFNDTYVTVASNILKDAERLASKYSHAMRGVYVDVSDVS